MSELTNEKSGEWKLGHWFYVFVLGAMLTFVAVVFTWPNAPKKLSSVSGDVLLMSFRKEAKDESIQRIKSIFDESKSVSKTEWTRGPDVLANMQASLDLTGEADALWSKDLMPGDHLEVLFRVDTQGLFTMKSVINRLKKNPLIDFVTASRGLDENASVDVVSTQRIITTCKWFSLLMLFVGAFFLPYLYSRVLNTQQLNLVVSGVFSGIFAFFSLMVVQCLFFGYGANPQSRSALFLGVMLMAVGACLGVVGNTITKKC